nr:hypothetical protein [Variovorax paradoxus]
MVARVLRNTVSPALPSLGDEDETFRISLAGAQEKTARLCVA